MSPNTKVFSRRYLVNAVTKYRDSTVINRVSGSSPGGSELKPIHDSKERVNLERTAAEHNLMKAENKTDMGSDFRFYTVVPSNSRAKEQVSQRIGREQETSIKPAPKRSTKNKTKQVHHV